MHGRRSGAVNLKLLPQKCINLLPVTRGCVFSGVFLSLAASDEETFGIFRFL